MQIFTQRPSRFEASVYGLWAILLVFQFFNFFHGDIRAIAAIGAMALAGSVFLAGDRAMRGAATLLLGRFIKPVLIGLALYQLGYCVIRAIHPHLNDIGGTTVEAAELLVQGANPYTAAIDVNALANDGPAYGGYKYLPVMALAYAPLAVPFGARGLLATNLVLQYLTAWLIGRGAGGGRRGMIAAALYLAIPFVAAQIYRGSTDLVPVTLMLAGMLLQPKHPFLSGLATGLSLSAKLFPAGAVLPCLLPATWRARTWTLLGGVVGLLPAAFYYLRAPAPFVANIITFNGIRPPDLSSWLYDAPAETITIARFGFAAVWLLASLYLLRLKTLALTYRAATGALLILAALLAGPAIHQNYHLWWIPLALVALVAQPGMEISVKRRCSSTA
jgi:hypothetical protein